MFMFACTMWVSCFCACVCYFVILFACIPQHTHMSCEWNTWPSLNIRYGTTKAKRMSLRDGVRERERATSVTIYMLIPFVSFSLHFTWISFFTLYLPPYFFPLCSLLISIVYISSADFVMLRHRNALGIW